MTRDAIALVIAFGIGIAVGNSTRPRLVGIGCDGSNGPLYANEEDHFPKCKEIDRA